MIGFQILLFAIGLVMLIKGGDWFVDCASGIARRFHLPELLIGATVVSIGTTLPEVMVSAQGALAGSGGMAYGNAIGSIICNTALIAAITVTVKPGRADRRSMLIPVSFFFIAAIFYVLVAYLMGEFTRWVGIVLVCGFVVYMLCTLISMKRSPVEAGVEAEADTEAPQCAFSLKTLLVEAAVCFIGGGFMVYKGGVIAYIGIAMAVLFLVYAAVSLIRARSGGSITAMREIFFLGIGAAVIAGGANLLVDSGTLIAEMLGVPATVISLTFVALGTSLPELVTAITSLAKGHGSLSLGNIIGANLFNLVLVSGISTVIMPFAVPVESTIAGFPTSLVLDIPVMLCVMLLLTVPAFIRQRLSRVQGILLLGIYAAFFVLQFVLQLAS